MEYVSRKTVTHSTKENATTHHADIEYTKQKRLCKKKKYMMTKEVGENVKARTNTARSTVTAYDSKPSFETDNESG